VKPPVEAPTSSAMRAATGIAKWSSPFSSFPAARDVGMRLAAHFERDVFGDRVAGLVQPARAGEDQSRHDQSLCSGTRFGQSAFDQRHIEPGLGHVTGAQRLQGLAKAAGAAHNRCVPSPAEETLP
jgi:hypothetical protein